MSWRYQILIALFLGRSICAIAELATTTTGQPESIEAALSELQTNSNTQSQQQSQLNTALDMYAIQQSQTVNLTVSSNYNNTQVTADGKVNPQLNVEVPADQYTISLKASTTCTVTDNTGNTLASNVSIGNFQPAQDMFQPSVIYTATCGNQTAAIRVFHLWYGVGGKYASYIVPTQAQASACLSAVRSASKTCAAAAQMGYVGAAENGLAAGLGSGQGVCPCPAQSGSPTYYYKQLLVSAHTGGKHKE